MIPVVAISTGKIQHLPYSTKKPMISALDKIPFTGRMWLSIDGFSEDEQAYKDHGGPHKAVCCFSQSNYDMYKEDLAQLPTYAMFGENVTVKHLDERDVYFGNQYRLGEAILEVSEMREPCWKIQAKYQISDLVKRMTASGKTGFYFRVIQEGYVSQEDNLELLTQANKASRLSVYELNDIYYNDRKNISRISYALNNPYLSPSRREKLSRLYHRACK
ncbi:molybdenum cofactor biosysynthesis protein [Staphylococcus sp. HMSC068D08]|uniref:MOSC domain-containing protein n=1 Tax=Staphylococcus TaxID=1279 RepID=UPI0008A20CE3|nr:MULTISPECIES: MOSC domain-containing protein [Staphylococcus]MCC2083433.1 MOSC domain-containing protein [Staphylococcus lugdunensis]MCH8679058.1 MOSC domain-containing protein [Staphylococcus lugdunensis]MCI2827538.1 MOSC domain-containing protein [Staphylococcus lugdunensis]MCI2837094.1 MOSC domain-containing protein [Staphylococcus lugdunensis]MCM3466712.1 MOSC domain-containing protein [Staphylococcus lugdunensis]